jgi:hypothetical protein
VGSNGYRHPPASTHAAAAPTQSLSLPAHLTASSNQLLLPTKEPAVVRAERLAALRSRLYRALTDRHHRTQQEEREREATLRQAQATLAGEQRELTQSQHYHVAELDQLAQYAEELHGRIARLDQWIREHEHEEIDAEAHCTPDRVIDQQ